MNGSEMTSEIVESASGNVLDYLVDTGIKSVVYTVKSIVDFITFDWYTLSFSALLFALVVSMRVKKFHRIGTSARLDTNAKDGLEGGKVVGSRIDWSDLSGLQAILKRHDAVLNEWEEYRTDPTLIIENPAIVESEAHDFMIDFVDALEAARDCRPDDVDGDVGTTEVKRYEQAVLDLRKAWGRAKSESKKYNVSGMSETDRKLLQDARSFLSTFEGAQTEHERANAGRALYNLLERRFGPVIIAPGLDQLEQQIAGQIEA